MTRLPGLSQWHATVSTHLPHLTKPHCAVLGLWSLGIVLAQSCGLTRVAVVLAAVCQRRAHTVREPVRDWYRDAAHTSGSKRGQQRRTLVVSGCFAPLLRWVVARLPSDCRHLALAMDAATLGQRFTILTSAVLVRGCAIPVAWHIVAATRPGVWRPHWEAVFEHLQGSVPAAWTVIVAADRGLYAKWRFPAIQQCGWHPYLRINRQGQYCPQGSTVLRPLREAITQRGHPWAGPVTCFATKQRQLACTMLARWDATYRDPWLIVTDRPAAQADVVW